MSRLAPHLSYANVVATLALFAALGGGAYASGLVGSKDIANHSIRQVDVKRNALGGGAIRESKLGRVRAAERATVADLAGAAGNSNTLAGLGAGAFERSSRIQYGRGPSGDGPPTKLLFAWPQMGVEVRTDGDTLVDPGIDLRNTNATRGLTYSVDGRTSDFELDPGQTAKALGPSQFDLDAVVTDAGEPGRSLWIRCTANLAGDVQVRCFGIRSSAR